MGGEGSHPLAESSGGETGEHSPAPGDLFACYKIQLILLPVLPGKEEQGRREDDERKGFKHLTVTFPNPRAGTKKPPNYPPARKYPEGGEAEQGSRFSCNRKRATDLKVLVLILPCSQFMCLLIWDASFCKSHSWANFSLGIAQEALLYASHRIQCPEV